MAGNETKIHPREASNIIKNNELPSQRSLSVLGCHLNFFLYMTSLMLLDRKAEILELFRIISASLGLFHPKLRQ